MNNMLDLNTHGIRANRMHCDRITVASINIHAEDAEALQILREISRKLDSRDRILLDAIARRFDQLARKHTGLNSEGPAQSE